MADRSAPTNRDGGAADSAEPDAGAESGNGSRPVDAALDELRELILAPEQGQIGALRDRLDHLTLRPEQVSEVLPQAIVHRAYHDSREAGRQLSDALMPTVKEAIQTAVRTDPRALADALFPLLGSAIRKSIAASLKEMLQSLSQTIDHSFTIQGVKWRIEALRTGKPFSEVAFLHTLVYQVEQVFLIHRETGLLLQHVAGEAEVTQDADMVSGMMTAIQDFVHDSFGGQAEGGLENMAVGPLQVWFERGPRAVLAAVIRGIAPHELRVVMQEAIESIHLSHGAVLEAFEGDASAFESTRPVLEDCLRTQRQPGVKPAGISPLVWVAGGVLVALIVGWIVTNWIQERRWSNYVHVLESQPGIVVVRQSRSGSQFKIAGLRDPLAPDPANFLQEAGIAPSRIVSRWDPYLSFAPRFTLLRARSILDPPASIQLYLHGDQLEAKGAAPHAWIQDATRMARLIPGIRTIRFNDVRDATLAQLEEARRRVERATILFLSDTTDYAPGLGRRIRDLRDDIERLQWVAHGLGTQATVTILGHTDGSNDNERSSDLRRERAVKVRDDLVRQGVSRDTIKLQPGPARRLHPGSTPEGRALNRCVTFQVGLAASATATGALASTPEKEGP